MWIAEESTGSVLMPPSRPLQRKGGRVGASPQLCKEEGSLGKKKGGNNWPSNCLLRLHPFAGEMKEET